MISINRTTKDRRPTALQSLRELCTAPPFAEIGLPEETGDIVRIGAIQEFGAPDANIPKRSFLRDTMSMNQDSYADDIVNAILSAIGDNDTKGKIYLAVSDAASRLHSDVIHRIDIKDFRKNAAFTIRKKGFDHPLVETGDMRKSIMWRMRGAI